MTRSGRERVKAKRGEGARGSVREGREREGGGEGARTVREASMTAGDEGMGVGMGDGGGREQGATGRVALDLPAMCKHEQTA